MKRLALFLAMSAVPAKADLRETLIGGSIADKKEYPEVIYISDGGGRCSATVIGPRVILTAGHCVEDLGRIRPASFELENELIFTVGLDVFAARCEQAPLYREKEEDHDLALCTVDHELPLKYASVASQGPRLRDKVVLMGYGCTRRGGGGGNDGVLRMGLAPVTDLPYPGYHWYHTRGNSALCFGDSGGPNFAQTKRGETHQIIGVNSRGDISRLSMLIALWTKPSQDFFKYFAQKNKVQICGINKDC